MARYKRYEQAQTFLIPFDVDVNIPQRSFVRFLNDFFDKNVDIEVFSYT